MITPPTFNIFEGRNGRTSQDPVSDGFTALNECSDLPLPFRIEVNYGDEFARLEECGGEEEDREREPLRLMESLDVTDDGTASYARWTNNNNLINLNRISPTDITPPGGPFLPSPSSMSNTLRNSSMSIPLFRPVVTPVPSLSYSNSLTTSPQSGQPTGSILSVGGSTQRGERLELRTDSRTEFRGERGGMAWMSPRLPVTQSPPINPAICSSGSSSSNEGMAGHCSGIEIQGPCLIDPNTNPVLWDDQEDQSILVSTMLCHAIYLCTCSVLVVY